MCSTGRGLKGKMGTGKWVNGTMNPRNKRKKKWDLDWDSGSKIKLRYGIYKYTLLYAPPHNPHAVISHHFVPLWQGTLGSLIAFLCCHNQLFLFANHITKHEGDEICIVMRRPEIYQSSRSCSSVTVDNRLRRDQFVVKEVLGGKFTDIRVLKGRCN